MRKEDNYWLLFLLFLFFIVSCGYNIKEDKNPKMINTKRLLKAYGFTNGIVEGISSNTSDEGYISVSFIDPFPTSDRKVMQIVKDEIPPTRIGALRIFSLWLFKTAIYPKNKKDYIASINDLRDNWLKKGINLTLISPVKGEYKIPAMTFTDEEIADYYAKAIRNKIEGIKLNALTGEEVKQFRELLIAYCIDPTQENNQAFAKYAKEIRNTKQEKAKSIDSFMEELSPELKKTLGL